jgi:hypothetical protein
MGYESVPVQMYYESVAVHMYEGKSKSKGTYRKEAYLLHIYRKETNITFQRNPPRLNITGSRVLQVFQFHQKKKFFGCVFNQFWAADETWLDHLRTGE